MSYEYILLYLHSTGVWYRIFHSKAWNDDSFWLPLKVFEAWILRNVSVNLLCNSQRSGGSGEQWIWPCALPSGLWVLYVMLSQAKLWQRGRWTEIGLTGLMLFHKFSNNLNLTEKETLKIKTQSLPPPREVIWVIYSFGRHFHQKDYSMKL